MTVKPVSSLSQGDDRVAGDQSPTTAFSLMTMKLLSRRGLLGAALALPALPAFARETRQKLFDSHLHFFTNDIARYPIDPRGAREPEAIMRARIMAHPGTPDIVFPMWRRVGVVAGAGVQYSGAYKTDNRYILDLADRYPERIRAEVIIDGRDPASADRLAAMARTRRVSAVRLTGYVTGSDGFSWYDSSAAHAVWAAAARLGLPVGITFVPPKGLIAPLTRIAALADRYPNCTILLEHMGRLVDGELSPAHLALRERRNVHFKLTTNVIDELKAGGRSTASFVRRIVDLYGADRLMWGSDFGNTLRPYPDMVADAVAATARLTTNERQRLLHDNGAAMFNRLPRRPS